MKLNLTNLKDLEYICEIAEEYFLNEDQLPHEQLWLERIRRYRLLFQNEIQLEFARQPGPCIVCGKTNYPLSMGGPQICPACDCGHE